MTDQRVAFGRLLAAQRTKKNLSQREMAAKLGVSDGSIEKWELGDSLPKRGRLEFIAIEYGLNVEAIITAFKAAESQRKNLRFICAVSRKKNCSSADFFQGTYSHPQGHFGQAFND